MQAGLIGTGNMGNPMARNMIKAGHQLVVHDLRESAVANLVELGARWAASPREVAALCPVVFTSLPGPADVQRVLLGRDGVLAGARPGTVVVTTPNAEYNVRWESLPAGRFRHPDHRFEWTRAEFAGWAAGVAERHGYGVRHLPVGPEDPEVGAPTQMAVFER